MASNVKTDDPQSTSSGECHRLLQADRFAVERVDWVDNDGQRRTKDVIRHPGAVVILPILDGGRLCLIRNRRVSVGETLLEVPAGTLDPDETPLDCAHRELREETGYTATQLHELGSFYVSPGILDERLHLFFATGLTEGRPQRMPDEDIQNQLVTHEEAMQWLHEGEIHDAKTMIALLRYPLWQASRDHDPS